MQDLAHTTRQKVSVLVSPWCVRTHRGKVTEIITYGVFSAWSSEGLLALLREIGRAYVALSQYDCRKAIALFSSLPPQHYNTGWVLSQVGRARYELAEYQKVWVGNQGLW